MQNINNKYKEILELRNYMWNTLKKQLPDIYLNGDLEKRLPGNLNISFSYVEGEGLMMGLKDFAVSSGSACTSSSLEPSYVLKSIGVSEDLAHTSIRFCLGYNTTKKEVEFAISRIITEVNKLRKMSPLWEMAQKGIDISSVQWTSH